MDSKVTARACTNHKDELAEENHSEIETENKHKKNCDSGYCEQADYPHHQLDYIHTHSLFIHQAFVKCLLYARHVARY